MKKVLCIKNKITTRFVDPIDTEKIIFECENEYDIIIGKWYELLSSEKIIDMISHVYIINNNVTHWYPKELFISIKQSRKEKIKKLNENIY